MTSASTSAVTASHSKAVVILGAIAAVAVAAGAYWWYSCREDDKKGDNQDHLDEEPAIVIDNDIQEERKMEAEPAVPEAKAEELLSPGVQSTISEDPKGIVSPTSEVKDNVALGLAAKTRGNKLYNDGKFTEAIDCYTEALTFYPKDHQEAALAYSNRAACYMKLQDYDAVIENCSLALEIKKTFAKALERRSRAFEAKNNLKAAMDDMAAICYMDGFSKEEHNRRLSDLIDAIASTRASSALTTPKMTSSCVTREKLIAYQDVEKFSVSESLETLTEAIKAQEVQLEEALQGNNVELESNSKATLGNLYFKSAIKLMQSEQYDDAYVAFKQAVAFGSPSFDSSSYLMLATFDSLAGDLDSALININLALEREPRSVAALSKRAVWQAELGNVEAAMEDFSHAFEIDSRDPVTHLLKGEVLLSILNDPPRAAAEFARALELAPHMHQTYIQSARASLFANDADAAQSFVDKAMLRFPNEPDVFIPYAEITLSLLPDGETHRSSEIIRSLEQFQKQNPKNPKGFLVLASMAVRRGQYDEAARLLQTAIEVDPLFHISYFELAMLKATLGEMKQSLEILEKCKQLVRNSKELMHVERSIVDIESQQTVALRYPELADRLQKHLAQGQV